MKQRRLKQKRFGNGIIVGIFVGLAAVSTFMGCNEPKTASQPVPQQKPQPGQAAAKGAVPISPAQQPQAGAEKKPESAYSYNPLGRRDPFMPLIIKQGAKEREKSFAARPPLERYDIKEFKLTGIVWGGFGYNAMLEAPDGKGYFIRVGSVIGPNKGVVKRITQDSIIIEEKFKSYTGETQAREIVVKLKRAAGGEAP